MKKICFYFLFLLLAFLHVNAKHDSRKDSIIITKVWDKAPHNAFPDLFQHKKYFYATFRESTSHVGNENDGKVRVVRSKDLKKWETVTQFHLPGIDIREARLSAMPDGRMLVTVAAGVWKDNQYLSLEPYVSYSDRSGNTFTALEKAEIDPVIKRELDWIWRVTWHNGTGYGVMYQTYPGHRGGEWKAHLLKTTDGKKYEQVVELPVDGNPNECTIRFDKAGKMYILIRRESKDKMGVMATADYPYKGFSFQPLKWRLGGPNFIFLNDHELIIGSRFHEEKTCTALFLTDLQGNAKKIIRLPSNGDSSYPGLVIYKKKLWALYYSSHEGKTSIYMAEVPLSEFGHT
ncbi:MAG: hypothetical protein KF746_22940 [Chitinophagaceae bacterium]|nr:hypothetical protein [Chitinophagaceae bacterium]